MTRAKFPLNALAVAAANAAVRDLVKPAGRALDPSSPKDAAARNAWMQAYAKAGGPTTAASMDQTVGDPVVCSCPPRDLTTLFFRRVYADGSPIAGIPYRVTLADGSTRSGTTDASGLATQAGVPVGAASVVYELDPNPAKSSVSMEVHADFDALAAVLG